jgi:hypothetical protein
MGVCVHPMARPCLGRWPAGVSSAVCPGAGSRGLVSRRWPGSANGSPAASIPHPHVRGARRVPKGVS